MNFLLFFFSFKSLAYLSPGVHRVSQEELAGVGYRVNPRSTREVGILPDLRETRKIRGSIIVSL